MRRGLGVRVMRGGTSEGEPDCEPECVGDVGRERERTEEECLSNAILLGLSLPEPDPP